MSPPPEKHRVLSALKAKLREQLDLATASALSAHGAATHSESKAEDKYDTRGLEASYLAGAQSKRAMERQKEITQLDHLSVGKFVEGAPIAITALVGLAGPKGTSYTILLPFAGGLTVCCEGISVQSITPQSPLGQALLGKSVGDEIEVVVAGQTKDYEVISVT